MSSSNDPTNNLFYAAPIGADGDETRQRSDEMLNGVIKPAARELRLSGIRADEIAQSGKIGNQVVKHLVFAKLVVTDLTGLNANVCYEMAIRDSFQKPQILIAEKGTSLPFDLYDQRTIFVDSTSIVDANACRDSIIDQGKAFLEQDAPVENLITTTAGIATLAASDRPVDRTLGDILEQLQDLSDSQMSLIAMTRRSGFGTIGPHVSRDLDVLLEFLNEIDDATEVNEHQLEVGKRVVSYLLRRAGYGAVHPWNRRQDSERESVD